MDIVTVPIQKEADLVQHNLEADELMLTIMDLERRPHFNLYKNTDLV